MDCNQIKIFINLEIIGEEEIRTKKIIFFFLKSKKNSVGSTFGRFFTVGANEPKPNGPDTMNLVEKMGSRNGLY